jgi:hypothetical protein
LFLPSPLSIRIPGPVYWMDFEVTPATILSCLPVQPMSRAGGVSGGETTIAALRFKHEGLTDSHCGATGRNRMIG